LHRQQELAEETLFRALESRACCRQRLAVERFTLERVGDARGTQRCLMVPLDDRLSGVRGTAQERGERP
ncbi:hypothetical protein, partial [Shewanella algae]|uniref:hypothetical protein n=1 Tax=Shewanella algae TaxID=38313 RepID=UPI00313E1935